MLRLLLCFSLVEYSKYYKYVLSKKPTNWRRHYLCQMQLIWSWSAFSFSASGQTKVDSPDRAMPQKLQKNTQNSHYIELGGYQYWPVLVPRGIRLYTYEQIPVFLRENPYITDGYRAYLPSRLCIKRWAYLYINYFHNHILKNAHSNFPHKSPNNDKKRQQLSKISLHKINLIKYWSWNA